MGGQRPRETGGGGRGRGVYRQAGGQSLQMGRGTLSAVGTGEGSPSWEAAPLRGAPGRDGGGVKEPLRSPSARPAALLLEPGAQRRGFSASWGLVAP